MQRIIRLFMIAALIVATIPHSHATSNHVDVSSVEQPQTDHEHDDHDHDSALAKGGWDHSHGAATADHVHDKPFPAQDLAVPVCPPHADWCAFTDDERITAPSGRLDRPPRAHA